MSATDAGAPAGPGAPGSPPGPDTAPGPEQAGRPSRNRTARFAWAAIAVLLVGVIGLVVYALTGSPATERSNRPTPASGAVVAAVSHVPAAAFDAAGATDAGTPLVSPTVLTGQPPLQADGRPEVLWVGAEFCPFCGAERWPLIVAMSRFGHFTGLGDMQSSNTSVFPGIQTFTFVDASYASPYLAFTGVELYSDAPDAGGAYTPIARLSPSQAALVARYGTRPGTGAGSLPFVDVANRMVTSTSGFSPAVLVGLSQATVAGQLAEPAQPGQSAGRAIVASANQLTAGMCAATGGRPAEVCTSKGVRTAAQALGTG
ncbi:MAG: DUF929 family protein [Acidimicrobiales bacterium]